MVGSSRCQHLNIIHLWRAVSVIYLLYNSSINIGVTANKNMFNNNVQTLSCILSIKMSTLILFDFVSHCFALGFVENHAISGEILWFKINLPRKQKTLSHPGVEGNQVVNPPQSQDLLPGDLIHLPVVGEVAVLVGVRYVAAPAGAF